MRSAILVVSLLVLLLPRGVAAQDAPPAEPTAPPAEPTPPPAEPNGPSIQSSALTIEPKSATPVPDDKPRALGESCRATADCADELRCVRNVCAAKRQQLSSSDALHRPEVRGYVGGLFGVLEPILWRDAVYGGFQAALHLGFLYRGFQFQLELAPATMAGNTSEPILGMFQGAATVGYLAPIGNVASWILRLGGGGGGAFGEERPLHGDLSAFGEVRAEVFGVAIPTSEHLVVELNVPSYRFYLVPKGGNLNIGMAWVTSFALHYML